MKKRWSRITALAISAVMIFAMFGLSGCGKEESTLSMAGDVEAFMDTIDMDYAYNTTYDLAYDEDLYTNEIGFRNSASDAEHKAADYLVEKMEELGLEDIEKIPVTVDKWQFNSASLKVDGMDEIQPISYASYGTDADGITAEIVDVGDGTAANYEGKDVEGKIVVASVDQWNEYWINLPMEEAKLHGAAAIVTYANGGYSQVSDDAVNVQDICTDPSIPCVSVSKKQGKALKKAEGKEATLIVDNEIGLDNGTSYNVVGKIKGKSSDQQIIYSAHYDAHFIGFQDDCAAIGLILSVAKAMKESDYQPENDILFVCHGSEEWGGAGSEFDWAIGSYELINNAKPEWAEKTIAVFNFELPAYDDNAEQAQIRCVPELRDFVKSYVADSGLLVESDVYKDGTNETSKDTGTYDDNISYRFAGIPTFTNLHNYGNGWYLDNYHTSWDNSDTYSEDMMAYNIGTYGTLGIMVDKTPALPLNFQQTCNDLREGLNEDIATAAGVNVEEFNAAVDNLEAAAEAHSAKIQDVNDRYEAAAAEGNTEEMDKIREEGKALNKTTLEIFKKVQDELIWVYLSADVTSKHGVTQDTIDALTTAIASLEAGELYNDDETGALDVAWNINGGLEYGCYGFSEEVVVDEIAAYTESKNPGNLFWGTGKVAELANTYKATYSLLQKADGDDFTEEIAIYKSELEKQKKLYNTYVSEEIAAINAIADMMK